VIGQARALRSDELVVAPDASDIDRVRLPPHPVGPDRDQRPVRSDEEAQAAQDRIKRGSAYWEAGWDWIAAQRLRRPKP